MTTSRSELYTEIVRLRAEKRELVEALEELVLLPNKKRPEHVWEKAKAALRKNPCRT